MKSTIGRVFEYATRVVILICQIMIDLAPASASRQQRGRPITTTLVLICVVYPLGY